MNIFVLHKYSNVYYVCILGYVFWNYFIQDPKDRKYISIYKIQRLNIQEGTKYTKIAVESIKNNFNLIFVALSPFFFDIYICSSTQEVKHICYVLGSSGG